MHSDQSGDRFSNPTVISNEQEWNKAEAAVSPSEKESWPELVGAVCQVRLSHCHTNLSSVLSFTFM